MRHCAILMAAGLSSRFGGGNKLLAPFRGKPLVYHTLDLACTMGFEGIFIIYNDEEVARLARNAILNSSKTGVPVTAVYNPAPEKGQGESARLGVQAAGTGPAYYLFMPCDQPFLDAATVGLLLDAAQPGHIVEPCCPDNRECNRSPSLFCASFRDELLALKPGEQPRLLKSRHPQAVISIEITNPIVLTDIDTREAMNNAIAQEMRSPIRNR